MKVSIVCAMMLALISSAASAAALRDGATIRNSGSTNARGYLVKVWSDGSALVQEAGGVTSGARRTLPAALVRKFFTDVHAARGGAAAEQGCMKSASFGSTTIVSWHGWSSPDIECPASGKLAALAQDAHAIVASLPIASGRRIPMLPNERRRPIQPSPSPGQQR